MEEICTTVTLYLKHLDATHYVLGITKLIFHIMKNNFTVFVTMYKNRQLNRNFKNDLVFVIWPHFHSVMKSLLIDHQLNRLLKNRSFFTFKMSIMIERLSNNRKIAWQNTLLKLIEMRLKCAEN